MEYKWVGNHPQDLASGLVLAPGETAELSDEDVRDPHNASLIADGGLISVEEATAPNATDEALQLVQEHKLDLAEIPGTGSGGRVKKSDVEEFLASKNGGVE